MSGQYSFSHAPSPPHPQAAQTALALDTGSPLASVALAVDGEVVGQQVIEQRRSSGRLLAMIDDLLDTAGLALDRAHLLVGLRGPGSFTGLRVGLATLQGMHLALHLPVATYPTLQVLATLAPRGSGPVTACVDALRGQWMTQEFDSSPPYRPLSAARISTASDLPVAESRIFVGFEVHRLRAEIGDPVGTTWLEPGPLAPQALRALVVCPPESGANLLSDPLYLRPPAAEPPGLRSR